nr:reverse transcriptase domain-containing protein [Tanacetum cinerariifolium]
MKESKKCSWSSKGQKLEAVRVLWCADYNIHYNTVGLAGREKISTYKVHSGTNAQQFGESSLNPTTSNPKRRKCRRLKQPFILEEYLVDTMTDQHIMAELLRAPTEGYAEAIVVPPILAEYFELKHSLINMMNSDQFFKLEKDNPHDHIRWFNKITSTIKYKDVPNSEIKLMLFPFSLTGATRCWLEKEPPHFILTWEDLVSKFINEFFPPSRTTNLQNEISNFQQRFNESFHEAWDCYKDLLRACPHYGFTELHQLNTFYNALNPGDQDFLNSAAGGNHLERRTQDVLTIIENKSKQTSVVTTAMTAILKQFQTTLPPAFVKSIEEIYVTCGGNTLPKFWDNIQGYISAVAINYNQGNSGYRPLSVANQIRPPEPLPSNTVANPKGELKAIIARSGLVLDGPFVPMPPSFINPDEDERAEETLTDSKLVELFLRTARALIGVHREAMILYDGDERLTLNIRHDTSSYSNQPLKESINMINIYNDSYEDYLKDLFATNHLSGNPTFSSHTNLTSPEVINPLSGSTTFSSPDHLLEEFVDELTLITFPSGNDDLPFDIESDLREIEYLINHDPTKEMDSILEDSVDEYNHADPNNDLVNTIPEMFTDEHTLDYSSPPLYDDFDDVLVELESNNDDVYDDPFDSKEDKSKESKLLIDELDPPRSSDFLPSLEYDSVLYKDFFKVDALPSTNNEDKEAHAAHSLIEETHNEDPKT